MSQDLFQVKKKEFVSRIVASLSVDELQGFKLDQKGFILANEDFFQLVRMSQELFQVKKKEYVDMNLEIKDEVAGNRLGKGAAFHRRCETAEGI